jgi:tetratricopeptide (TPR) repeat protein
VWHFGARGLLALEDDTALSGQLLRIFSQGSLNQPLVEKLGAGHRPHLLPRRPSLPLDDAGAEMTRRLPAILFLALLAATTLAAAAGKTLLVARDLEDHPLPGLRFAYGGVESGPTNSAGATELALPPERHPGQQIKIHLLPNAKAAEDWFLVNPRVTIPIAARSAKLVLMRRRAFRQLAAEARDAPDAATPLPSQSTAKSGPLVDAAARHGLTAKQLATAIVSFGDTRDPKDRGIASYLKGQYAQAEKLLRATAEKKERDLVETLHYLAASQFEQAKYRLAGDNLRKAIALSGEDVHLLRGLGRCHYHLAEWAEAEPLLRRVLAIDETTFGPDRPDVDISLGDLALLLRETNRLAEAEPLMRRALEIDEKSFGPDHPRVAISLNNLALVLQDTNRLAEAEPLMRRALAIDEKNLGPDHPDVAVHLNNLALLLKATNRLEEAEPLMRRALAINEKSFGPDHPRVAGCLNNLAQLLQATNRCAEAEPLIRRALAIDERSLGPDHPTYAMHLNNWAQLLQATNRTAEAEPLMRRALAIGEKSLGPDHPDVAIRLSNLAMLLQETDRVAEAEPLMRRALAINEKSFGPDHPSVAISLNNLAEVLKAADRLAEAEPLMRRSVLILLDFTRRTGHEHPHLQKILANYSGLLQKMGKSRDRSTQTSDR